ncbi:hypothetical protein ABW20_dc0107174 [Dactylellina cionopaga]|nr:hypothetical protein ABW20_dc0107174 [Dactylellina cionopaga]
MRETKIEESADHSASQITKPGDEMVDVQPGEVSPGGKSRKRTHDEIVSKESKDSTDSTNPTNDTESRSPSRAANGEPVGKKMRTPPRETDEKCMLLAPIAEEVEYVYTQPGSSSVSSPVKDGNLSSDSTQSSLQSFCTPKQATSVAEELLASCISIDIKHIENDCSNNDRQNDSALTSSSMVQPESLAASSCDESAPEAYEKIKSRPKLTMGGGIVESEKPEESKDNDTALTDAAPAPSKEESKEDQKTKLSGGFSNTSSVSPFGSLATKPIEAPPTTTDASTKNGLSTFATSKFSTFANVASPFAVSPSPLTAPSPFAGPPTGSDNVFSKMSSAATPSAFSGPPIGSANVFAKMSGNTGASGFGSTASPFGSGSSIFGNSLLNKPLPKAQPLTGIKDLDKSERTDNQDSDNDDDGEGDSDVEGEASENPKNTAFAPKRVIKTGEEEYDMVFQARAKLFELSGGGWKERGVGNIRVLTPKSEDEFSEEDLLKRPTVGRIVMRQEGVGRLILNTSMFKDMLASQKSASDNTIRFMAINNVSFGEGHDESSKDGKAKDEKTKGGEKNGDGLDSLSEQKPVLRTYSLRFKSADLVDGFKDNILANSPV